MLKRVIFVFIVLAIVFCAGIITTKDYYYDKGIRDYVQKSNVHMTAPDYMTVIYNNMSAPATPRCVDEVYNAMVIAEEN